MNEQKKCNICQDDPIFSCNACGREYIEDVYGNPLSPHDNKTKESLEEQFDKFSEEIGLANEKKGGFYEHGIKAFISQIEASACKKVLEDLENMRTEMPDEDIFNTQRYQDYKQALSSNK